MGVIDVKATNKRFTERCISRTAWAVKHGINAQVFSQRLNGRLKITPEIAEKLREDNLLVMEGEK